MILYEQQITKYCILVINGDIDRNTAEDGGISLVFKSIPRLIINSVNTKIGEPIGFIEAFG